MAHHAAKRSASMCEQQPKKPRLEPFLAATTLQDLVTLLHLQMVPFLTPRDLSRLLSCLSHCLTPPLRECIATAGLQSFYAQNSVHFGRHCGSDWHQLVPEEAEGGEGPCDLCDPEPPKDLPLPRLLDARVHLLEAACLVDEGFSAACNGVLQMHFGEFAAPRFGSMQPVVFSLSAALEKQGQDRERSLLKRIKTKGHEVDQEVDTDDVAQLTRLMDSVHIGVGTHFFSGRKQNWTPTNAVEAHWRGIVVDSEAGTATCRYCEYIAEHSSKHRCERCTQVVSRLLQQHCKALYQPLKRFMLRHLKHVSYMKPRRGWNCSNDEFRGDGLMDLIAGFTPAGVLCGVYLTDLRIPARLITSRLALGAFKP
ncbi:hypothetical protein PRIC1_010610 [Phytophthora ramorum]|uniref:uncharacterized protein n=1 Tax=Phytophthora ramorum TaxID=164328 RepID=UPI0030ABDF65|nr:hypothetical protein KRP23_3028 [Phytophthora ramorum]KAH7495381.1 hypothetical protein KRP22_14991 [Phytophthora ramorum]